MKRVPYELSEPQAFRVKLTSDTAPLFSQLEEWVSQEMRANPVVSKSAALSTIVMGLVAHYMGLPAPGGVTAGADMAAFKESLKSELMGELRGLVEGLVNSPEHAGRIYQAAQAVEDGDAVDDDFVDNLLSELRNG